MANTKVRDKLSDVILDINVAKLANRYFKKSSSWLYHKFDGTDGRIDTEFSEEELRTLKGALCDLADRLRSASDSL